MAHDPNFLAPPPRRTRSTSIVSRESRISRISTASCNVDHFDHTNEARRARQRRGNSHELTRPGGAGRVWRKEDLLRRLGDPQSQQ